MRVGSTTFFAPQWCSPPPANGFSSPALKYRLIPADIRYMPKFWIWGVRNPCVLLAGLATASGLYGVADWSICMATVLIMGLTANIANHLARRAHERAQAARAGAISLAEAREARKAFLDRAA
jgi:hypothetical protein